MSASCLQGGKRAAAIGKILLQHNADCNMLGALLSQRHDVSVCIMQRRIMKVSAVSNVLIQPYDVKLSLTDRCWDAAG